MDNKKTLLVVDDIEFSRQFLVNLLLENYHIIQANNGKEALEVLEKYPNKFSAILLDIVMPVMDGLEFLQVQQQLPHLASIPVIVTTGTVGGADLEIRALEVGASDFLTKPYHPAIIKQRIANIIKLRETSNFITTIEKDTLTGLYKKEAFYHRASDILASSECKYDLICTDADNFKAANQLLGEIGGDALLKFYGSVIYNFVKQQNGVAGRLNSDTFAILISHTDNQFEKLEQLYRDMEQIPYDMCIPIRIGVYNINDKLLPINTMCDYARLAIKTVKGKFDQHIAQYDDYLHKKIMVSHEIERNMKDALKKEEFKVFFQPKCYIENGKIIGAEALVRWDYGKRGLINPADFIPIFENNGFIVNLDLFVWESVCKIMRKWIDSGIPPFPVSVNVSRVDLCSKKLPDVLEEITGRYAIPKQLLRLEITETVYAQNLDHLLDVIKELKNRGFCIEMDDFGSGYSSLNMLSSIPIDILKLDMRFLQSQNDVSKASNIIEFIIKLGQWLQIPVVAEGIETSADVSFLKRIGCKYGQGYYFAKPMPVEQFEQLLSNDTIYVETVAN